MLSGSLPYYLQTYLLVYIPAGNYAKVSAYLHINLQ